MDLLNTEKSTHRECQRRLFIDALYRELDKIAANADSRNSALESRANTLVNVDGLSEDSCVDMLVIDGFDSRLSRQCVASLMALRTGKTDDSISEYNYTFEDSRGRIFTGRELGETIEAQNKEEAYKMASDIVCTFDPPVRLISVDVM